MSKWNPVNTPSPHDEKMYDIRLHDGSIIKGVEYWAFGGGWTDNAKDNSFAKGQLVDYPLSSVSEFREQS